MVRWPWPAHRTILVCAWIAVIVYAFPGYMNFDVGDQLYQIRRGHLTDYHPPMMAGYWSIFEVFVSGPFPMLLLQTTLFLWGLYTLLCSRLSKTRAAWATAALALFPPILTPMGMIWKDAQMSAFLAAGSALLLVRTRRVHHVLGFLLFVGAAGVRHNGGAALPLLLFAATAGWTVRGRLVRVALAIGLTIACMVAASGINRVLTERESHNWYVTTAILDITGTICFAHPMSDDEVRARLDGVALTVSVDIQRRFCELYPAGKGAIGTPPWYQYYELFDGSPDKSDRLARRRAWLGLLLHEPAAYLRHRLTMTMDMFGVGQVRIWEPVGQDFAASEIHLRRVHHDHKHSWFQIHVGDACRWLAENTSLYRVYLYALFCALLFCWGLYKRDALVFTLTGSALVYELSLAIGVNAPDFRYSHWMIACTGLSAVLVAVSRWREGSPRVSHGPVSFRSSH